MHNFTVADLVQTTLATFAFALFLLPSGYLLGVGSNAFGFRSRSSAERLLFSTAFSIAATPICSVLLIRYFSFRSTFVVFLLLTVIALATLILQVPQQGHLFSSIRRSTWIFVGMLFAWFVVVQISLTDIQVEHRLYVSYVAYDYSVRVPLIEAAVRHGVPPLNPFYGLGKIPILRYYYYWYVVCALPMQLFGIGARACLVASVFWSSLGLASIIPLFVKYCVEETEHLRGKSVIAVALLAVTGLDLLPFGAMASHYRVLLGDMEWWDPDQVSSWLGSLLWVPHHVAGLTACMAGFLAISNIDEDSALRQRVWTVVLSGLAFASAAGLSVYVTVTFAAFAIVWTMVVLWRRRYKTFAGNVLAGVLSLLLSWPYLSDLLSKHAVTGSGSGTGERFAFFAVRSIPDVGDVFGRLGVHPLFLKILDAPILLIVYFLEFGFFFVTMALCFRRDWRRRHSLTTQRQMCWVMFAVCLLLMTFVKSDTTGSNDLGFRGMLVVQFVLLIFAAPTAYDYLSRKGAIVAEGKPVRWIRAALISTLTLGVAGTACQLVLLRFYPPLADEGRLVRSESFLGAPGFGERTFWLRQGYGRLGHLISPTAAIQYNPLGSEVFVEHLYSGRQAIMGDDGCGSAFGGDISACKKAMPYVSSAFNDPDTVRSWNLDGFCDSFHVSVLVANDTDAVWGDRNSWVWNRPALIANPSMRAIRCGTAADQ